MNSLMIARWNIDTLESPVSYDKPRLVRIVDTGADESFEWIVNDHAVTVKRGDWMLFSAVDFRMPVIRTKPSGIYADVILFTPSILYEQAELADFFFDRSPDLKRIPAERADPLLPYFERLRAEYDRTDEYRERAAAAAFLLLIIAVRCRLPLPARCDRPAGDDAKLVGNVLLYIQEHIGERLTVGSVADEFGVSVSKLSKLFNRTMETSLPDFVRRLRVNRVLSLLSGGENVLNAAMDSGFGSVSGFYKTFAEITGTTPTEMLKSGTFALSR